MSVELITPENVSVELLNDILAAYLETAFDEDGDLLVKGECHVYVSVMPDNSAIRLMTIFRIKEECSPEASLGAVNRINGDYTIKAHCSDNCKLIFTDYLHLAGGLTRKALVLGARRFDAIPRAAICSHAEDIVC